MSRSALARFDRVVSARRGVVATGRPALHEWSISHAEEFWQTLAEELLVGVDITGPPMVGSDDLASTRWFPDVTLNVAQLILEGRGRDGAAAPDDAEMLVAVDERGRRRALTRAAAASAVADVAAALRADGVGAGDRVVAWMPNTLETVVVMLAAASIGAVFSSTSPDFGAQSVVDRFGQVEPAVLVAADGYTYGGRRHDRRQELAQVVAGLPTLRRTVVVPFLEDAPDLSDVSSCTTWSDWRAPHRGATPRYAELPFDHPWYVLFSSGTTGPPKCIVHRAGGVLLQHLKEQQLHLDIRPGDRACYFTTCGWMMWNWLVSVPASGASAVLFEGNPVHPGPERLWQLVEQESLTFLGVSAKYLDACRSSGMLPHEVADLAGLRTLASTGSPLSVDGYRWVQSSVAPGCGAEGLHLASISGGTDLCGCFVLGDPTAPVYAGEIQAPGLGMAVDVVGEDGLPVDVGERGELVCTAAFPSMPLGFWGDDVDGARYRSAYFERFDGMWAHGDFAVWTDHGGMVILGRSDTTLNPGGVRIGTAEIYRQVERLDEVHESLVFGQQTDDDVRIVLLVQLVPGAELDEELAQRIRTGVRNGCTPRHVPALILAVDDLPHTRSGKLAELAVADRVNGREVRNTSALANPEVLDRIASLPELSSS